MSSTIIIAEAGVNHNGSLERAMQMVHAAKAAGADYVKFQTFIPEKLIAGAAPMAEYQKANTGTACSQLEMLKGLALTFGDFAELAACCRHAGIGFLSTPFDLESINFLEGLGMDFWKIPSGEITNYPYLVRIARTGRPVVMSTGMCTEGEIQDAMDVLTSNGLSRGSITLLHCNTEYPTPYADVNLRAMGFLRERFGVSAGYSDHTEGIEVPVAAVALGASVIEKHLTLDRTLPGPDHKASLEPEELATMIQAIRHIEIALGESAKRVTASESKNRAVARKSICAAAPIRRGEVFTESNICAKRPGTGISPMRWREVLGRTASRDFSADEMIEL